MQEVLRALVTHEFPLSDLDKAVDLAQNSKKVSKIIIKSV